MDPLVRILLILVVVFGVLQVAGRLLSKRYRFPAPALIGRWLDGEVRKRLQPPGRVIERSGIASGMRVLELGCGSGAFSSCAARTAGPEGKVYALDIQRGMLEQVRCKLGKAENRDIDNVVLVRASASELPFSGDSFDAVFMVTVLQEIPQRRRALHEIHRVLRPGGVLAVTEFLPDPDYPLKSTTVGMCTDAGFLPDGVRGGFWNYTARFTKP